MQDVLISIPLFYAPYFQQIYGPNRRFSRDFKANFSSVRTTYPWCFTVIYTCFGKNSQDEAFFVSHDNIHRDYKELIYHLYKIHVIILYLLHSLFNINHLITPHTGHKHLIKKKLAAINLKCISHLLQLSVGAWVWLWRTWLVVFEKARYKI